MKKRKTFNYNPSGKICKSDKQTIQSMNENMVLSIFRQVGEISKAEIAQRTGLSPATAAKIIEKLQQSDLIKFVGAGKSNGGRPPEFYTFNPVGGSILGLEVEADLIKIVVCNLVGEIGTSKSIPNNPKSGEPLVNLLIRIVAESVSPETLIKVKGLGIGFAGVTDPETGQIILAPGMENWEGTPIRAALREHFSFPIYFDNEVNMAALGEHHYGGWDRTKSLFFVKIERGIGGGLVINNHVYHGDNNAAGEIGLIPFTRGNRKNFDFDRLEDLAVGPLFEKVLKEESRVGITKWNALTEKALNPPTSPESQELISDLAQYLAYGLANVICLLDPGLIVIGGKGVIMTDQFIQLMRCKLEAISHRVPDVQLSRTGEQAVVLGSVAAVLQHFEI